MALDTSIALGVKNPQFQTIDPMTVYNAMQEQQYNALRSRLVEQQMAQNALAMQNTMEDRRAAAAKAAQERAQAAELKRLFQSGYQPAKNPVMGPGTVQGPTPAGFDYEGVKNKLIGGGNVNAFKTVSELQEQEANRLKAQRAAENESSTGAKIRAETEGFNLKNIDTQLAQISSTIDQALTLDDVYAQYRAAPDALAARGQTPDTAIKAFNNRVAQLTQGGLQPDQAFAQAKMEAAKGAMAVQKQLSDLATAQAGRTELVTGADGTTYMLDKVTGVAKPATVGAPAGTPTVAEAPALAGAPLKTAPKGQLTAAQKARLKGETADDFTAATEALRYVQDIERNLEGLEKTDISGATGYQSLLPSFNKDTLRAENDMKNLEGQLTALGRALASTSGKLGNLAVQEYEFLRQQVAAFDPYKGEDATREQLAKIKTSMRRLSNTVRDRYSRAYGDEDNPFPQFRELPKNIGEEPVAAETPLSGTTSNGIPFSIQP